jgi:hypothetical protein
MAEVIHRHTRHVAGSGGREYEVLVYANQVEGHWEAWLEFHPRTGGLVLRTDRETSQTTLEALHHWASTLGPAFVEGAFERAFDNASV